MPPQEYAMLSHIQEIISVITKRYQKIKIIVFWDVTFRVTGTKILDEHLVPSFKVPERGIRVCI
jgi:hypothetical protein